MSDDEKNYTKAEEFVQWADSLREHGTTDAEEVKKFADYTLELLDHAEKMHRTMLMAFTSVFFTAVPYYKNEVERNPEGTMAKDRASFDAYRNGHMVLSQFIDDVEQSIEEVIGGPAAKVTVMAMKQQMLNFGPLFFENEDGTPAHAEPKEEPKKKMSKEETTKKMQEIRAKLAAMKKEEED